jgi:hypothetical protein
MASITVYFDYAGMPHTYCKLDDGTPGNARYYGFAPAKPGHAFAPGKVGVALATHALGDTGNRYAGYIDDTSWSKTVEISQAAYTRAASRVAELMAAPPDYSLPQINCTWFVKQILAAADALYEGISSGPSPMNLLPWAERENLFETDSDGSRRLKDFVRFPANYAHTPAYDARLHPENYGL